MVIVQQHQFLLTGGVPFDLDGISILETSFIILLGRDASGTNWNNYSVTNGFTSNINGLPVGLYTVTIEDGNGCLEYEDMLEF